MAEWIVEAKTLETLENGFYSIGNNGEPVVRCKDCEHWEKDEMDYKYGWCRVFEVIKYENGYCDEGKRRDDG